MLSFKDRKINDEPYPETTENIDHLFQAVEKQEYSSIFYLLNNRKVSSATVNYANKSRPSLLIECCQRADEKLLQLMIRIEKDQLKTFYEDVHGHRALWYAIEKNFLTGIHVLLENKLLDPNLHDTKTSLTPILQAIERKRTEIVDELIRAGADVNMPPRHPSYRGLTPLILAIISGTEEISQSLINSLCSLNQTVEDGYTALHYSVLMSRHSTINCLLKAGARTNVRSLFGVTPMTLAILCDDPHSVKLLIEHGYPITRSYPWNEYPIEHAIRIHSEGSAMMIVHLGCELKLKAGNRASNALTMAANEGLIALMYLILFMQPQWINQAWIRRRQYPYALYRLKNVQDDLQRMFSNPFRLKQLCRAKISQTIGKFYTEKIVELKKEFRLLNDQHIKYLQYSELVDPVKHFRPVGKRLKFFEVNGIEFYWDQQTLRYRKQLDEEHSLEKRESRTEMKSKNAIVRVRSLLMRRQQLQEERKKINAKVRLALPNHSRLSTKSNVKTNQSSTGGFLPRKS